MRTVLCSLLIVLLTSSTCKKEEAESSRSIPLTSTTIQRPNYRDLIPPVDPVSVAVRAVSGIPTVHPQQLPEAMELIASLRGRSELSTTDDLGIQLLVEAYTSGQRRFRVRPVTIQHGAGTSRMAYTCTGDHYAVAPDIRPTTPLLAASLYHELAHELQCREELEKLGTTDRREMREIEAASDPCVEEPRAYAAQIRFIRALFHSGNMPTQLSSDETSDFGLLQQTQEAWLALLENRFCEWYRVRMNLRESEPTPGAPQVLTPEP